MTVEIIQGDCLDVLRGLPAESVNCCVTSPPYWGQRDYGHPGQIGLEVTPEIYIDRLIAVFSEVRRVLRDDGTLWLNLADSYANDGKWGGETGGKQSYLSDNDRKRVGREKRATGLKAKDMVGVPWRVAFGLQASGWWLRSDIIWSKTNGLCESVRDRCTQTHEYIFMLAKSERYYFDYKAIEEPCQSGPSDVKKMREQKERLGGKHKDLDDPLSKASRSTNIGRKRAVGNGITRRARTVWTIATTPYRGGHYATFPRALASRCIMAGCPEGGMVLDPFMGTGTTALAAQANNCNCIGIELNPEYVKLAKRRNQQRSLLV